MLIGRPGGLSLSTASIAERDALNFRPVLFDPQTWGFDREAKFVDRESELKRYIVPFPFPGFSALWYTKQSPNLKVVPGMKFAVVARPPTAPSPATRTALRPLR